MMPTFKEDSPVKYDLPILKKGYSTRKEFAPRQQILSFLSF